MTSLPRIGFGYDVHRFAEGRKLILGGVEIPYPRGLQGHSDADVLLHAIADALLGAAALGDIGKHFPDTDARFKGVSSLLLLQETKSLVAKASYRIINIDATLVLEEPRIGPYADRMRRAIAGALGIDAGAVSVKATTTEGLDAPGRKEGVAAFAVAALEMGTPG